MREQLFLGTTPYEESCEQIGANYNAEKAKKEAKTFIAQLVRTFGEPVSTARYRILNCPHDFGTYKEVVIDFDVSSEEEANYAFAVENNVPADWDEQSKIELGIL